MQALRSAFAVLLVLALMTAAARASEGEKLLIKIGWDCGPPAKLVEHIDRARELPFDGHTLRLDGVKRNALSLEAIPRSAYEADFAAMRTLAGLDTGNAQHNFVLVWFTSPAGWDWFDDGHWEASLSNLRTLAELADAGDAGLFLDPESYPKLEHVFGPGAFWSFTYQEQPRAWEKSFAEYEEIVFERGASFMRTVAEINPEMPLISMYGLGFFADIADKDDPAGTRERLAGSSFYGLYPAFVAGMLSVAPDAITVHDGNEPAYYYTEASQFEEAYDAISTHCGALLPEGVRPEFDDHYRVAHAIYASDLYPMDPTEPAYRAFFREVMPREEQREFLSHNTHYALAHADRYAWFYTEGGIDIYTGAVPDGMLEAIVDAKAHLERGEAYPTGITERVREAADRRKALVREKLEMREGVAVRSPRAPVIDGVADERVWTDGAPDQRFLATYQDRSAQVPTPTTARFAYDNERLYLLVQGSAVEGRSPRGVGSQRDDDVWRGDSVQWTVADPDEPSRFWLFMVGPEGVRYDAHITDDRFRGLPQTFDLSYDPAWRSASRIEGGVWTVEAAIPWSAIGGRPEAGAERGVNLLRRDTAAPGTEYATWSQVTDDWLLRAEFGMLRLE